MTKINIDWKLVLVVIVACVSGYLFWNLGGKSAEERYALDVARYQTEVVKPALAQTDSLKRIVTSAVIRANAAEANAQKTEQTANALKTKVQILEQKTSELSGRNRFLQDSIGKIEGPVGELVTGLRSEITTQKETIDTQKGIIVADSGTKQSLRMANANLRVGVTKATERADSLEHVIRSWPQPPKPMSVLGITIPVPSRAQVFVAGIVTGVVTYHAARK